MCRCSHGLRTARKEHDAVLSIKHIQRLVNAFNQRIQAHQLRREHRAPVDFSSSLLPSTSIRKDGFKACILVIEKSLLGFLRALEPLCWIGYDAIQIDNG